MPEITRPAVLWIVAALSWMLAVELESSGHPGLSIPPRLLAFVLAVAGGVVAAYTFHDWRALAAADLIEAKQHAAAAGRARIYKAQSSVLQDYRQLIFAAKSSSLELLALVANLAPPNRTVRVGGDIGTPGIIPLASYSDRASGIQLSADMLIAVILDGRDDQHVAPERAYSDSAARIEYRLAINY